MKHIHAIIMFVIVTCVFGEDNGSGLAIRIKITGNIADITINHDYINIDNVKPRIIGVRQNSYSLPLNSEPQWVGWKSNSERQGVLLESKKYQYIFTDMDRTENGMFRVQQDPNDKQAYILTGVYCYNGLLFIVNHSIKEVAPLFLYENSK